MTTKKPRQSRTLKLNAFIVVGAGLTALLGTDLVEQYPGSVMFIVAAIAVCNAVLRLDTNTGIKWALLLALLVPAGLRAQPSDPSRASYRVWVESGNGRNGGSATGISPHLLVTNVHVVGKNGVTAEVLNPLLQRKWSGQAVAVDPAADVALVFVASGDLEWVELGPDPQPQQPCWLFGYGGDSVLKLGNGRFLAANGVRRGTNVPVWNAAVESIDGDSGSGLFDAQGKLVAVNWGADERKNMSASTPVSHVRSLADRWYAAMQQNAWCGGRPCYPPGYGGGGGGYVMPPKEPVLPPTQPQTPPPWTQPQQPIVGGPPTTPLQPIPQTPAAPAKPELSGEQLKELAGQIAALLAKDERVKGPQGESGKCAPLDLDALSAEVAKRLPPLYVDAYVDGQRKKQAEVRLGEVLNLHHNRKEK